jgi:hypothetical protein
VHMAVSVQRYSVVDGGRQGAATSSVACECHRLYTSRGAERTIIPTQSNQWQSNAAMLETSHVTLAQQCQCSKGQPAKSNATLECECCDPSAQAKAMISYPLDTLYMCLTLRSCTDTSAPVTGRRLHMQRELSVLTPQCAQSLQT